MFFKKKKELPPINPSTAELVMINVEQQLAQFLDDVLNDRVPADIAAMSLGGTHSFLAGYLGINSREKKNG